MAEIISIIGIVIVFIGGILLLIEAFRTSVIWGLACLIINPVSILFIITHWDVAKTPFLIQLFGFVLVASGSLLVA